MVNIGVFFGGKSGEHEVSLRSGTTVMAHLDHTKYRVFALGIRKDGSFAEADETGKMIQENLAHVIPASSRIVSDSPGRMLDLYAESEDGEHFPIDLFFPVLHGSFGEDGTLQGMLEMMEKPYVGCGVSVSSVAMDKALFKLLMKAEGLPVLPWLTIYQDDWMERAPVWMGRILKEIGMPCFVKPARAGSSVGISKVSSKEEVIPAITEALLYDHKILVEQGIPAREIECSVMGNRNLLVSRPGEIVPQREFYDYIAKYVSNDSELVMPAELTQEEEKTVRDLAERAFSVIGAEGYARVDFLLDKRDNVFYVNEINTIPGFTAISMFPKLWSLEGMELRELLGHLIALALERHEWQKKRKTDFEVPI